MNWFLTISLLTSVIFADTFDIPDCNGQTVQFNKTADEEELTWYPLSFKGSEPPMFPNDYVCTYQINVPDGWSAMVQMRLNLTTPPMDGAISVQVIDQNQKSEAVASANGEHFYFTSKEGRILLATRESNVVFGFAVKWTKHPDKFVASYDNVNVSAPQPTTYYAFTQNPIVIKAETRVSLVVTPPVQSDLLQYLRSVVIYDGPDWNSTCLGSAYQVFRGKRQFVSSGKYMTVQQLRPSYPNGRTVLIFQDYENTKDIVLYQGAVCQSKEDCGQYVLEGSLGKAAVSTIGFDSSTNYEYITSISGSGKLEVYNGGVFKSKSNLIASYSIENSAEYFPQVIKGYIRTYVLTGKIANINSTSINTAFSESATVGRKGFLSSWSYKMGVPWAENTTEHFGTPRTSSASVNFSFTIREADLSASTTLTIIISNREGSKSHYRYDYSHSNSPKYNETISAVGDDFYVQYSTGQSQTNGFYLDYEISKSSSHAGLFISLIVFFSLLAQ